MKMPKLYICSLIIIITLCAHANVPNAHKVRKANNYIKKGELDKAELIYNNLTNTKKTAFNKGFLYSQKGDVDKALYYYQIVTQNPKVSKKDKAKVNYNLGNNQFRQGEFEAAIASYRQGLLRDPHNIKLKYNLELANNAKKVNNQQKQQSKGQQKEQDKKQDKGQTPKQDEQKSQSKEKSSQQKNAEKALDAFKQQEQNDLIQSMPKQKEQRVEKDW